MLDNVAGLHNRGKEKVYKDFYKLTSSTKKHKTKNKLKSLCPIVKDPPFLYIWKMIIQYSVLSAGLGWGEWRFHLGHKI